MNAEIYNLLKETETFDNFIKKGLKIITEESYNDLFEQCYREAGIKRPENWETMGVYSKMGWSNSVKNTFLELFLTTECKIRKKSDFEVLLKEYIKQQDNCPETPFEKLQWYAQKRQEFHKLLADEDRKLGLD
jgi:hypothetical protein